MKQFPQQQSSIHLRIFRLLSVTVAFFSVLISSASFAAKFPYDSAYFVTETTLPGNIGSMRSEHYILKDAKKFITAEWATENNRFQGSSKKLNLTKNGFVYAVDLVTRSCTQTDIKDVENTFDDPEEAMEMMKTSMNMKKAGKCEGSGYDGVLYESMMGRFCFHKDIFMLWTEVLGSRTEAKDIKFNGRIPKDKISLPKGLDCKRGMSFAEAMSAADGAVVGESASESAVSASDTASSSSNPVEPTQEMTPEEAMKAAQDLLQGLGDLLGKPQ